MGRRWWRDLYRVGAAAPKALADDWFEVLAEAGLDGGEMIAAATEQDAASRKIRVRLGEEIEDRVGCQANLMIDVFELRWNFERVEGLMLHGEEAARANAGAGTVLRPLVLQKREVRSDVEVLRDIGGCGLLAAEDGVCAVVILRPKAVEDEAGPGGALGRRSADGAELR